MKRDVILISVLLIVFSFYSYDADALDCPGVECVCRPVQGGGEVRREGYELVQDCRRDDGSVAVCGNHHLAENCRTYCLCQVGIGGGGGQQNQPSLNPVIDATNVQCIEARQDIGYIMNNNGSVTASNVRIVDTTYFNNNAYNIFQRSFGDIPVGERSLGIRSINYTSPGNYYHDVEVYVGNRIYTTLRNIINVNIVDNEERPCCVEERFVPDENEACCDGMPTDGGYGSCGCPSGFRWASELEVPSCSPIAGQICYSSDAEEREAIGLCMFRWFTDQWYGDRFNQNILDCFRQQNVNTNPTQACCPYITYNNKEYGEFEDIVVY